MGEKLIQSAKFKRDYVTLSAVTVFFLIVASEVALAIALPLYVGHENVLVRQVSKLELLSAFDAVRNRCESSKARDEGAMQVRLVAWHLNLLANSLRDGADDLTLDEIVNIKRIVKESDKLVAMADAGKWLCVRRKLDTANFIDGRLAAGKEAK
ncbi:MAG: hypothetical protein PHI35_02305 [Victivallaceae bacterium]|nr:hypothetical protein [Victivallaceae bacterium]